MIKKKVLVKKQTSSTQCLAYTVHRVLNRTDFTMATYQKRMGLATSKTSEGPVQKRGKVQGN